MSKDDKIANLEQENAQLKTQLSMLQSMLYGSKSEKRKQADIPDNQLSIFAQDKEQKTEPSQEITVPAHKRKKKKPVRTALPEHLERVEEVIEPDHDLDGWHKVGEDVTEVLECEPARLFVRRIIRPRYVRDTHQENSEFSQANLPSDLPFPKSSTSASLAAQMVVSKFIDHIPIHRFIKQFERQGVYLKNTTLIDLQKRTADKLSILYDTLTQKIQQSNYLQIDESTIKVMGTGKKGKPHQGYMWYYLDPKAKLLSIHYASGRDRKYLKEHLHNFSGYAQTDGYKAYDYFDQTTTITQLNCWAHARRYFFEAHKGGDKRALEAVNLIGQLYELEKSLKEESNPKIIYQQRQKYALPVINTLFEWAKKLTVLPKSQLGKAIHYLLNREKGLRMYLTDGKLLIDNNPIENKIRPLAIGRKNYMFAGNEEGAKQAAMFYAFFATAKMNDIEPFEWLKSTLEKIDDQPINKIEELLPVK
ncbi:IS66 family transposase (plasmid) [Flammeovirga sp. MY04]|uniref:IS66 family transposase n=1 Tax=Flammeovirga sp. MY04 TaxID=1191459 RepID=UPI0014517EA1|nr:IS66 family transposase [Flammeovirga sp. MY04]ANQ52939.2 IS66 family transposase [Flammeovirga sp. MY04]